MMASSAFLMFGLVFLAAWSSEAEPVDSVIPAKCCFNFIDFPIPVNKIVSAVRTGSHCPRKGIVVTTPKTEFCVRPDEEWIKPVMEKQLQK